MAEITYQGLSRVPDDYTCADGQAALSLNLVPENGALQPIFPPSLIFTLPTSYKVAYIHKTTAFTHYIITRADDTVNNYRQKYDDDGNPMYDDDGNPVLEDKTSPDIYYLDKGDIPESKRVSLDDLTEFSAIDGTKIVTIQAVGNTLIIITDTAMNYYLWKTDDDGSPHYQYLGTHLPEISVSFGLKSEFILWDTHTIKFDEKPKDGDDDYDSKLATYKSQITEQVMAQVNKFIADEGTNSGKFIYPFLIRYAYRMYDDSLTMHSAPILMIPCSGPAPLCSVSGITSTSAVIYVEGNVCSLDYLIETATTNLNDWQDIIFAIDIFISAPLYTIDQSGEMEDLNTAHYNDLYSVCKFTNPNEKPNEVISIKSKYPHLTDYYQYNLLSKIADAALSTDGSLNYDGEGNFAGRNLTTLELPTKSESSFKNDVASCCNFYLLKSCKLKDIHAGVREDMEIADDYMQSLVTREVMSDDYDSHDTLVPSFAYNYNNRLTLANIKKNLFTGYPCASMFCHSDGYYDLIKVQPSEESEIYGVCSYYVYFYIKQENKIMVVRNTVGSYAEEEPRFLYIYYPNTNAYKAVVTRNKNNEGEEVFLEVDLTTHDFLNGAFYFDGWENSTAVGDMPQVTDDNTVSVANKLYLSEINNPFFFPVEQIVTVGTGRILGIATAAKPLSQGQFGSFPLYAFCDDGVWALSVNNEGIYSAVQPITRDVCINEKAITQIDSSVLFPTDRGIMQISGNAATCITDVFDSDDIYPIEKLPHYEQLLRLASSGDWDEPFSIVPITDFLSTAVILYDYTNQRIFVCNDGLNYAYVFSIKSQQWGMATVDISSVVNSYPDAYAMTPNGDFVDFTHPDTSAPVPCMYVTRPLKLDGPNALKTVTAVLQRGFFDRRHVQSAIFGSRDLLHYHTIRTSQTHELRAFAGTPYKYFRVAILAQLEHGEAIFGATINSTPRLTNKAR